MADSFFTEKYFGYNRVIGHTLAEADLSLKAAKFFSKNYLLIHGTSDTVVHQQHTMLLTKALIQQGVIFRHQVGVREKSRVGIFELFQIFLDFFLSNFFL